MVGVEPNANEPPDDDPADEVSAAAYGRLLADGVDAVIATWVVRSVVGIMVAWRGEVPGEVALAAEEAAQEARRDVGGALRRLVTADVDDQRGTPLALLRAAVRYPTTVLAAAGVPPVERDAFSEEAFPDDVYDLTPANLTAVDPSLADPGMAWGAAKAWEHRRRHAPPDGRTPGDGRTPDEGPTPGEGPIPGDGRTPGDGT